jgi:hypothetical protein
MPPTTARPAFTQLLALAWRLAHQGAGLLLLLALALVGLPDVLLALLLPDAEWATATITLRALLAMLAVAVASHALLAAAFGRRLPLMARISAGLRAATPAVQASLLAGAAVMLALTIHLFSRHGTFAGWALDVLLLAAGLWGAVLMLPVVPVAVVEGLGPRAAFARAMALTDGVRNRLVGLVLFCLAWFLPFWLLAATAPPGWTALLAAALRNMVAMALLAVVPTAVYLAAHDR